MTKEQIKTQIEILRTSSIEEKKLIRDNSLFSDDAFDDITSPIHKVAYFLLKHIIHIPDSVDEKVYIEFEDYMYGLNYGNIDQLLLSIEKIRRDNRR